MCTGNRLLVRLENFGHVMECGCGTLHVGVGPVSVALDAGSLRKLHSMLEEALTRLEAGPEEVLPPSDGLLVHGSHFELRKVVKFKH